MNASDMGKKGGVARWKKVPKKARSEHARNAAKIRWDNYRSKKQKESDIVSVSV